MSGLQKLIEDIDISTIRNIGPFSSRDAGYTYYFTIAFTNRCAWVSLLSEDKGEIAQLRKALFQKWLTYQKTNQEGKNNE